MKKILLIGLILSLIMAGCGGSSGNKSELAITENGASRYEGQSETAGETTEPSPVEETAGETADETVEQVSETTVNDEVSESSNTESGGITVPDSVWMNNDELIDIPISVAYCEKSAGIIGTFSVPSSSKVSLTHDGDEGSISGKLDENFDDQILSLSDVLPTDTGRGYNYMIIESTNPGGMELKLECTTSDSSWDTFSSVESAGYTNWGYVGDNGVWYVTDDGAIKVVVETRINTGSYRTVDTIITYSSPVLAKSVNYEGAAEQIYNSLSLVDTETHETYIDREDLI